MERDISGKRERDFHILDDRQQTRETMTVTEIATEADEVGICVQMCEEDTRSTKEGRRNHLALPGRPLTLIHCCCKAMYEVAALWTTMQERRAEGRKGNSARISQIYW